MKRVKGLGNPKPGSILDVPMQYTQVADDSLLRKIAELEAENSKLKDENTTKDRCLQFLSVEQIQHSAVGKSSIKNWSNKSVTDALKLGFAVDKFGYNYLRSTGYPCSSYSTLNRRMQNINVKFGILYSILNAMKCKVNYMCTAEKWYALMIDEMEISSNKDFDISEKRFIGRVTLGLKTAPGKHYLNF